MTAERLCPSFSSIFNCGEGKMKKINTHERGSLIRKILRLLTTNRGSEKPLSDQEEIHLGITASNYYNHKEIETVLLEAERKKAQAIMERQRRHFIC